MGLHWVMSSIGLIIACVLLLLWVRGHRRAREEAAVAEEAFRAEQVLRAEQASHALLGVAKDRMSIMEQREQRMAEARAAGRCMYCPAPAKHPYPTFKRVRSITDPLLRFLGVKQIDRWRVATGGHWLSDAKHELCVCTAHQQRAMGLLEECLAKSVRDLAKSVNEQGLHLYEFEVSGVHDVITEDMRSLRDPKAAKQAAKQAAKLAKAQQVPQQPDNVRPLRAGNGNGGTSLKAD